MRCEELDRKFDSHRVHLCAQILQGMSREKALPSGVRICSCSVVREASSLLLREHRTLPNLPLVLHQPIHTVRLQPARKWQQLATAVPTDAGGSVHNTPPRRSNDSRVHSSPNRTTAVRTARACRRTSLCNLRAHSFAQLPEHETGMGVQELRHHAAHDASKAVRASVTTFPSFLKQNGLMYGVIRRQDIDKRGLTIGCKTAMVSNRTAITLQCVLRQASAEPDRPIEAHFAASS